MVKKSEPGTQVVTWDPQTEVHQRDTIFQLSSSSCFLFLIRIILVYTLSSLSERMISLYHHYLQNVLLTDESFYSCTSLLRFPYMNIEFRLTAWLRKFYIVVVSESGCGTYTSVINNDLNFDIQMLHLFNSEDSEDIWFNWGGSNVE